ncbi:MAG: hypothetical protein ACR2P2_21310, partial [Nakamurella sp.]
MVTMAEAGMPLRLVAEGQQQALWQIIQRGPVGPPPPGPSPYETQGSGPIGRPVGGAAAPESSWGLPGTAAWTDRQPPPGPAPGAQQAHSAAIAESAQATVAPVTQRHAVGVPAQATGLSGERVTVTVAEVIDPGNQVLTNAGYRLDDGERAVLVRTTVANAGPAAHDCMPDLYLFLVDADGKTLPKAPVSVVGHPAHRVGVAAGGQDDGWTIFLINADTTLSGVRWCVRPDLVDRTLTWSL